MMQQIGHWVNCSTRRQFCCNKIFSNINAARLFSKFKIIATCDTKTRCNVQYPIALTVLNLTIKHQIVN